MKKLIISVAVVAMIGGVLFPVLRTVVSGLDQLAKALVIG